MIAVIGMAVVTSVGFAADDVKSLVPVFSAEGSDIDVKAKDGNKIKGWLPKDWVDNSEWAAVSAVYSKLPDPPKENVVAIRIKVDKADEGQLQLTTWTKASFKKGVKYVVEGSIRSKESSGIKVGVRQSGDPYEMYADQTLDATPDWKPFTFEFSLTEDKDAILMFQKTETGSVDLAAPVIHEKK